MLTKVNGNSFVDLCSCPANSASVVAAMQSTKSCQEVQQTRERTLCQTQVSSRAAASSRELSARSGAFFLAWLSSGGAFLTNSSGLIMRTPMLSPSCGSAAAAGCAGGASDLGSSVLGASSC